MYYSYILAKSIEIRAISNIHS